MTARQQSIWSHCLSLFLSAPLPYTIKFTNYVLGAQSDPLWRPSISQMFQPSYAGTITAHNPYSDFRKKYEPPHEKTNNLHMRNQRRRSVRSNCEADHRSCFRYTDSTISLFSKSKIYSLQSSSVPAQLGLHLCRNHCGVDLLPSHVQ